MRRVVEAMKPETLDRKVTPGLVRGIERWGGRVLADLGVSSSFDMKNPLVTEYLDAWREQRIVGITQTARDQVTRLLQDLNAEGVGIGDMKRALRETFEGWTSTKAATVARTEVVSSSNAANVAAYQISGLVDAKEWLAVPDENTRETHREMDGQQVGITETFKSPSGNETQAPGMFGVGEEDINCRCTVRPIVETKAAPSVEERAALWRKFDADLTPWEKSTQADVAEAIGVWLGDAVSAL